MLIVYINKKPLIFTVNTTCTVLEACLLVNIKVPTFCYHPALLLEGNCRMCLIEIENIQKPQASCCLPIQNGIKIYTDTPMVKKARENVLELLLVNHPLDCPICDQGGECDLQDHSFHYGSDTNRFFLEKRSTSNKFYNSFIKTIMTRCIHCTKCIRFSTEYLGYSVLGSTFRGKLTEIGPYVLFPKYQNLNLEFSGNLVDICPVGALTSKPYSFTHRPWEVSSIDSLDFFDSFGANISIFQEPKSEKVIKILPKYNKNLNSDWINDRIRYSFDSWSFNRIKQNGYLKFKPILQNPDFSLKQTYLPITNLNIIFKILKKIKNNLNKHNSFILYDSNLDLYSLSILKSIETSYKFNLQNFPISKPLITFSYQYLFNSITKLSKIKECIIFGCNTRIESSYINLKLIHEQQTRSIKIFTFGYPSIINFTNVQYLGFNLKQLSLLKAGLNKFCLTLLNFKLPIFLFNSYIFERFDGHALFKTLSLILTKKKYLLSINALHSNEIGASLFGLTSKNYLMSSLIKFNYNLNFNNTNQPYSNIESTIQNLVYKTQGFTEYPLYLNATLLPFEFSGTYINTNGFKQKTISTHIDTTFLYKQIPSQILITILSNINKKNEMLEISSIYKLLVNKQSDKETSIFNKLNQGSFQYNYIYTVPFTSSLEKFYEKNQIVKLSKVLQKYTQLN